MLSHTVNRSELRWQKESVPDSQGQGDPPPRTTDLGQEVYQLEVTDRETLYADSFSAEWARLSNYSPDDFE